jgi:thioredoxin reductase
MILVSPRATLLAASLMLSTCMVAQNTPPPSPPGAPPQGQHMPMPKPTNLQVLPKDISGDDLMKIMHGYEAALGVECVHCHVVNRAEHKADFAADVKPEKKTARIMITMTAELNQKYLAKIDPEAKATCGTCHRGHNLPEAFVPPPGHQHQHDPGDAPPGAPPTPPPAGAPPSPPPA